MSRRWFPVWRLCVQLLLVIVIALSVVACGGYSSPTSPSNPGGGPTPTHSGGY